VSEIGHSRVGNVQISQRTEPQWGNAVRIPLCELQARLANGQGVNRKFFHFAVKRQLEAIGHPFLQHALPLLAARRAFAFKLGFYVELICPRPRRSSDSLLGMDLVSKRIQPAYVMLRENAVENRGCRPILRRFFLWMQ